MNNGKRTMWVWQRLCRCLKPRRQWVRLGSPTSGPCTGTSRSPVRKLATQQEVIGSKVHLLLPIAPHELYCHLNHCFHYCLNHPLPLLHRKIVFQETGPWCWKGWGPLSYSKYSSSVRFFVQSYFVGFSESNLVYVGICPCSTHPSSWVCCCKPWN